MKRKRTLVEVIGWVGVACILLAYILASFNVVNNQSLSYHVLNLLGALGLIVDAWSKKDSQPLTLNIVWAIVALIALVRA